MKRPPIIEIVLSLLAYWWAFICFVHQEWFSQVPELYGFLIAITTPTFWGLLFIIVGGCMFAGNFLQNKYLRKFGLGCCCFLYGLIASMMYLGSGIATINFGTYCIITIMSFWGLRGVKFYG